MRNRAAYGWSKPYWNYWQISYVYNYCLGLFLVFLLNGPYCAWFIGYWFEHLHSKLQFCNLEERTSCAYLQVLVVEDWRRQWHPTPVLLPGKSHRWRSLVGCNPWGCEESDTTEWLHFHFSLSCIGEGNGNPLQRSCLENHRDRGAWWAAVYGVAQSRTRLKRLSSSSRS